MEERYGRHTSRTVTGLSVALGVVLVGACSATEPAPSRETQTETLAFLNGDFETGTSGAAPPDWTVQTFINNGITVQTPQTLAGLDLAAGGTPLTTIIQSPTGPLTQIDPDLGAGASLRWPLYGNQCARVNFHSSTPYRHGQNVNTLSQTMTIGAADIDPTDNQVHVRFAVAPVLQNPAHPANEQPYYLVQLTDVTTNTLLYSDFNLSGAAGIPWQTVNAGTMQEIDYTNWQLVDIPASAGSLAQGDSVLLEIIASGCAPGGHFGEIYVDGGNGAVLPGLFVFGTAPTQANACDDLTYDLTYENGAAIPADGVSVTFDTPPSTTFVSVNAPGLTCTTPAVGATGTVDCTVGTLAAGGSGSFQVTVAIACGTTGTITAGTYAVQGTGIAPLLGSHIYTTVGCSQDSQCLAGNWCDETTADCTPTLANGTAVPTDGPHTNPTLDGTCTLAAGALVCTSGVCDTADNQCGYANGDGPCTVADGSTVCRSGVCDPNDLLCGLADGDGQCTVADGSVVCRSGTCSTSEVCLAAGTCDVDADCAAGDWCFETTHTCTPTLANGTVIPTDGPHTDPTLDGTCSAAAGALVCTSGVCDVNDNDCGYANGDGPCTVADGSTVCRSGVCDPNDLLCGYASGDGPCTAGDASVVCRSGACSTAGVCEPVGGCAVDADCAAGNWCNETAHACTPTLANGTTVATDAAHTSPTLNGTCTVAAGALVCTSGVCDTADNKCGYANGDGPCTTANGASVCRSGECSATSGVCIGMGGCEVDADCSAGTWCNETAHMCTPTLANGTVVATDAAHTSPSLNGTCTAAAGALVCTSGVCDTNDNKCGYANGDGPCTAADGATDCRSMICATTGANQGLCVACLVSSQCSGATPVCDAKTNSCVQCGSATDCASARPVCDPTSSSCVPCDGDFGSGTADPCGSMGAPFCFEAGSRVGSCGKCTSNADCKGHAGTLCDTTSGLCTAHCQTDSECLSSQWCDAPPGGSGTCEPKLANGKPLPTTPASVATCTKTVGERVCVSGACDTKTDVCGYAVGDGPCTGSAQCIRGTCDPTSQTCVAPSVSDAGVVCTKDSQCASGTYCGSNGGCTPTLPSGAMCQRDTECQSDECAGGVCSTVVSSGNGIFCAMRAPGSGGSADGVGAFGLFLAAAGGRYRRRRKARGLAARIGERSGAQ